MQRIPQYMLMKGLVVVGKSSIVVQSTSATHLLAHGGGKRIIGGVEPSVGRQVCDLMFVPNGGWVSLILRSRVMNIFVVDGQWHVYLLIWLSKLKKMHFFESGSSL